MSGLYIYEEKTQGKIIEPSDMARSYGALRNCLFLFIHNTEKSFFSMKASLEDCEAMGSNDG